MGMWLLHVPCLTREAGLGDVDVPSVVMAITLTGACCRVTSRVYDLQFEVLVDFRKPLLGSDMHIHAAPGWHLHTCRADVAPVEITVLVVALTSFLRLTMSCLVYQVHDHQSLR